ncbi:hypothetical protein M513_12104 [Trichuris suis]|uniref:C3H1-type domain-containing protein n=1 Tax=Trichuris suis TaxID=68888 RepID=A0A085LPX6_9BILA|nr:hypothetical protein M513_12104 [Trichuris suis]
MAEYLASIFGTEKDKVNCSFYFKIGACRHGDKCSRIHNRPTFSQTILLQNLYQNPKMDIHRAEAALQCHRFQQGGSVRCFVVWKQNLTDLNCMTFLCFAVGVTDAQEQQHFDEFFEEIFTEVEEKYGEIEEMNVCDNIGEHMIGNVYIKVGFSPLLEKFIFYTDPFKFRREEDADKAVKDLNTRWFGGMPIYAELSPVTDFREACCRQYEMGDCGKGGFCNFMHLKPISRELRRRLYGRRRRTGPYDRRRSRSRSRGRDFGGYGARRGRYF